MSDIKTLLIVITLVLITIIHCGFAPPREKTQNEKDCESLMAGRWFNSGTADACGKKNFLKAFKHYTYSMIHNEYEPPANDNETHDGKITRLLKRDLYTNYFLDLCITYASVFPNENTHTPSKWCNHMIKEKLKIPEEEQEDKILILVSNTVSNCTEVIQSHFKLENDLEPHEIYSILYDNYTMGDLRNISERELPINYPLGFFEHYIANIKFKYAKNRVHLKTIEDFCRQIGKGRVENKETLRDTIPLL